MSLKHLRKLMAATFCFAAIAAETKAGEVKNYATNNPPLPTITVAKLAITNETFEFNTANAAGIKTFCSGTISISTSGVITGSGKIETYSSNGTLTNTSAVTIQSGSKISAPSTNLTPINKKLTNDNGEYEQTADYRADAIIKFSNGFIARGKLTYEHCLILWANGTGGTGYEGYDDSEVFTNLSITGPNGHIGFMSDD